MINKIILFIITLFILPVSFAAHPDIYTVRGITKQEGYRAQQNTLDAIFAIKKFNNDHASQEQLKGCEVHVIVTQPNHLRKDPSFVCSHEENIAELTGENLDIRYLTREQIEKLQLKQIVDGIDYGKTRPFAFLEQVLDGVMKDTPPFTLWIGVKDKSYRPIQGPSYTAIELIKALEKWRNYYLTKRNIDIFQYIIVSSTNPFIVNALDKESKWRGLQKQGLNIAPDYADYGLPASVWDVFIDQQGGFERLFNLTSNWVALDKNLVTPSRIQLYHTQGKKILGWGFGAKQEPLATDLDALFLWY